MEYVELRLIIIIIGKRDAQPQASMSIGVGGKSLCCKIWFCRKQVAKKVKRMSSLFFNKNSIKIVLNSNE